MLKRLEQYAFRMSRPAIQTPVRRSIAFKLQVIRSEVELPQKLEASLRSNRLHHDLPDCLEHILQRPLLSGNDGFRQHPFDVAAASTLAERFFTPWALNAVPSNVSALRVIWRRRELFCFTHIPAVLEVAVPLHQGACLSPVRTPACDISAGLGPRVTGTAYRCRSWRHIGERAHTVAQLPFFSLSQTFPTEP